MAARNRTGLSENTRKRIKSSMIVNQLQKHILGEVEMSATQVTAALGLLRKTVPDLQATTLTVSGNVNHTHEVKESMNFNDIREKREEKRVH